MKISRLILQNWRCLASVNVPFSSRTIITGPCGVGKTSLLDSLCFLRDLASGISLEEAVEQRGGFSRLRNLEARFPETDIVLEVHLQDKKNDSWVYRLRFGEAGRHLAVKEETVWHSTNLVMRRPDREDQKDSQRKRESSLSPRLSSNSMGRLREFFCSLKYIHPWPQLLRQSNLPPLLGGEYSSQDFYQRVASTPEKIRKTRFQHISKAWQQLVQKRGEIKVEMDYLGRWHLLVSCEHWRPRASWQDETRLPDGWLRLVAIFWSIFETESSLLIEEPENGLHPEAISQMPRVLKELARSCHRPPQLVLSTHHPALWRDRLVKPEEILLFVPHKRKTRVLRGVNKDLVERFLADLSSLAAEIEPWLETTEEAWLPLFVGRDPKKVRPGLS